MEQKETGIEFSPKTKYAQKAIDRIEAFNSYNCFDTQPSFFSQISSEALIVPTTNAFVVSSICNDDYNHFNKITKDYIGLKIDEPVFHKHKIYSEPFNLLKTNPSWKSPSSFLNHESITGLSLTCSGVSVQKPVNIYSQLNSWGSNAISVQPIASIGSINSLNRAEIDYLNGGIIDTFSVSSHVYGNSKWDITGTYQGFHIPFKNHNSFSILANDCLGVTIKPLNSNFNYPEFKGSPVGGVFYGSQTGLSNPIGQFGMTNDSSLGTDTHTFISQINPKKIFSFERSASWISEIDFFCSPSIIGTASGDTFKPFTSLSMAECKFPNPAFDLMGTFVSKEHYGTNGFISSLCRFNTENDALTLSGFERKLTRILHNIENYERISHLGWEFEKKGEINIVNIFITIQGDVNGDYTHIGDKYIT